MSDLATSFAARIARDWVAVYTFGLPPSVRDARREELESDLWEQQHEIGTSEGFAKGLLARVFRGVPADILWAIDIRTDQGGAAMRAFDDYRKADKVVIFGLGAIAVLVTSTAIGASTPISLLIAAIAAVGLAGLMRLVFPPTARGAATDRSATSSRRRRLLATFGFSVVVIVAIGAYLFSLEHWGGLAFVLNVVGYVTMLVGVGALSLFVVDVVREKRATNI